ncbi:MAG: hypothetical protein M3N52_12040 [Actinomycetota bacterium]|nr:hypothetical protein [Actinomycetota bacterium]
MTEATTTPLALASGSEADAATIRELNERVAELQGLLRARTDKLEEMFAQVQDAKRAHCADVALIGEKLIEEANDRGWCAEFDTIVGELNQALHVELPARKREYQVAVTVTVWATVTAANEDDAIEQAREVFQCAESAVDHTEGIDTSEWNFYGAEVEES